MFCGSTESFFSVAASRGHTLHGGIRDSDEGELFVLPPPLGRLRVKTELKLDISPDSRSYLIIYKNA